MPRELVGFGIRIAITAVCSFTLWNVLRQVSITMDPGVLAITTVLLVVVVKVWTYKDE